MKLYLLPGCPFAHRATFVLREKGVDFEPVFFDSKARPAELAAAGPNAKSPTLFDGDDVIWDSQIVLEYLEDRFPTPALMPADAQGRATTRMLAATAEKELGPKQGILVQELIIKPQEHRDAAKVDAAKRELLALLPAWNARLQPGPFLQGATLGLADVTLYSILGAAERAAGVTIPAELPALQRWYAELAARPSAELSMRS